MARSKYDALIDHQRILGAHFVGQLTDTTENPVLRVGKRGISKHVLVREYGTGNFQAARNLFKAMAALELTSVMDFFKMPPAHVADIKNIGTTGLYVLICIGRARGVDIKAWFNEDVTFDTLKMRARAAAEESEERAKARTAKAKKHVALHEAGSHVLATKRTAKKAKIAA